MRLRNVLCAVSLALVAGLSAVPAAAAETYSGRIEVAHADDFDAGRSTDSISLVTGDGRLAVGPREIAGLAGREVTLSGTRSGDTLLGARVVQVGGRAAGPAIPGYPSRAPRLGERRLAVLHVSTATDVERRWDVAPMRELMFGASDSVDAYLRSGSAGLLSLTGEVHGWFTIGSYGGCNTDAILYQALAAARAGGVDAGDYNHVMVVFPRLAECPWNGLGRLDGPWTWINGQATDMRLLAHEVGHNLGVHHAAAARCTQDGAPVAFSKKCDFDEYGDPLDVMGHSQRNLFNVAHRLRLGWLAPEQSQIAGRDGTYELTAVNRAGGGVKELLVRHPDQYEYGSRRGYLSLELRGSYGRFDAFAPDDPAVTGLSVRLTYGEHTLIPQLLDLTPGSPGGHRDGQLGVGKAFTDPASGTTIRLESIRDGVARVRIGPGGDPAPAGGATAPPDAGQAPPPERGDDGASAPPGAPPGASAPPLMTPSPSPSVALDGPAAPLEMRLRPAVGARGRRLGRTRRISVSALGATGVRLEARLDGRRLARRAASRLALRLPKRALRGRHVLELSARDAAGRRAVLRLQIVRGALRR